MYFPNEFDLNLLQAAGISSSQESPVAADRIFSLRFIPSSKSRATTAVGQPLMFVLMRGFKMGSENGQGLPEEKQA
jgi:hypothetical protein